MERRDCLGFGSLSCSKDSTMPGRLVLSAPAMGATKLLFQRCCYELIRDGVDVSTLREWLGEL